MNRRTFLKAGLLVSSPHLLAHYQTDGENPVVIENRNNGTDRWQLDNPADDLNQQIKGYASATSVNKGKNIAFHVCVTPAQTFTIEIYRMGWYQGLGGRFLQRIGPINYKFQPAPAVNTVTGMIVCPWSSSYILTIPEHWTSGIFLAKLISASGYDNHIIFIVRDDARSADFLYQQPVTTYQAYNNYPNNGILGKSLYKFNSHGGDTIAGDSRAVKVSFNRPYSGDGTGQFLDWEYFLLGWLEKSGYDVVYATNIDIHVGIVSLRNYRAFLSVGHDEYWSKEMFDSVEEARNEGTHLAFFGANAVYYQIRFEDSARTVVCYKDSWIDPQLDPSLCTIRWRDAYRPEQLLVGIQFISYNGDFNKNTPYVVAKASHWVFTGTGFNNLDSVPGLVGYEVDASQDRYPLPVFTDYTILSESPFNGEEGRVISHSCIYQSVSGAWVFASGTMSWSWGLGKEGLIDKRIQKTTANILDRFADTSPV